MKPSTSVVTVMPNCALLIAPATAQYMRPPDFTWSQ